MPSNAIEDYLKAIYALEEKDGRVRTGALARQLGITAGSVTEMVKRLAGMSPAWITYRQHRGVALTDAGRRTALAVIRRHRLLETFLHRVLAMGWEAVHEEAEVLEHHLSDRLVDAIDRYLGHPETDPHGEPIPTAAGRITALRGNRLVELVPGTAFRIIRVDPSLDGMLAHLDALAVGLKTEGVLLHRAPFGGPLTLQLTGGQRRREAVVGRKVAERIYVESL